MDALGAQTAPNQSERELIQSFVDFVGDHQPQMVTFNGHSFDLPVLRYRAMIHSISAPGMQRRPYYHRFADDHVDICDVLSAYSYGRKGQIGRNVTSYGLAGEAGRNGRL